MDKISSERCMIKERINKLRDLLKIHEVAGYIVPSGDEYMSEYVPRHNRRLEYITAFTGSNGIVIILEDKILFFTDGRYLTQAKSQLIHEIFQIFDLKELANFPWHQYVKSGQVIGYDPKLFTNSLLTSFGVLKLLALPKNLVDQVWTDKLPAPCPKIYSYPIEFAGESQTDKLQKCRQALIDNKAAVLVITDPTSICWLLNLRSSDVPCTPIMLSRMILTNTEAYLFINDTTRIDAATKAILPDITVLLEEQFAEILSSLEGKILVDESSGPIFILDLITGAGKEKVGISDPCQLLKACKNQVEITGAINGHIKDGVAVCEFLSYVARQQNLSAMSEYDLGIILSGMRAEQSGYIMDSFPVICGFRENSAIIHYHALATEAKKIAGPGILLIDSGGQYMGATTDITRTIAIGEVANIQKTRYTQVLKGHIALSRAKFPIGTTGANLDILARQFLWAEGLDYPHGTGHGVGSFLSVHEGPQNISLRSNVPLRAGMILSNEPGFYLPGEFGVRIENLIYVKESAHAGYLEFENLTLVPYAKELIDHTLLENREKEYIQQYYKKIHDTVYPQLSIDGQKWLEEQLDYENH